MARLSLVWFLLFRCLLYTCTLFQLVASPLQYQITCGPAFVVLGRVMGPLLKCPVLFGISDVANVAALTVGWTTALHLKGELRYQIPDTRYFFFDLEMAVEAQLPALIIEFVAHHTLVRLSG